MRIQERARGWRWIPSVYFSQAIPYALVISTSVIFDKNLGLSNRWIAFITSWFFLPWVLKPLWAPYLESLRHHRAAVWSCQLVGSLLLLLLASELWWNPHVNWLETLLIFAAMALVSASFDMFSDGLYLRALSIPTQQWFVGVRSFAYQVARLMMIGVAAMVVGRLALAMSMEHAWALVFGTVGAVMLLLALLHRFTLPVVPQAPVAAREPLWQGTKAFFRQPHMAAILAFILLYNIAEAQMQRLTPLFLLSQNEGGLALGNWKTGELLGGVGILALSIGALVSGMLIARWGLKRCLWTMTVILNIANLGYIVLAMMVHPSEGWLVTLIGLAQLAFGLSNSAYMCVLLKVSKHPQYALTWYAMATALMALGMMFPGLPVGFVAAQCGFLDTFIVISALGCVSIGVTWLLARSIL